MSKDYHFLLSTITLLISTIHTRIFSYSRPFGNQLELPVAEIWEQCNDIVNCIDINWHVNRWSLYEFRVYVCRGQRRGVTVRKRLFQTHRIAQSFTSGSGSPGPWLYLIRSAGRENAFAWLCTSHEQKNRVLHEVPLQTAVSTILLIMTAFSVVWTCIPVLTLLAKNTGRNIQPSSCIKIIAWKRRRNRHSVFLSIAGKRTGSIPNTTRCAHAISVRDRHIHSQNRRNV